MNTVLFFEKDIKANGEIEVHSDRAKHMFELQEAQCGKHYRVAQVGGKLGKASVIESSPTLVRLRIEELIEEPRPPCLDLVVGISRPQTIKKILEVVGAFGVRHLFLVRSKESQKSYLSSKTLQEDNIFHHLRLGLEQAGSSYLPEVSIHSKLRPFVEDELIRNRDTSTRCFIADPSASSSILQHISAQQFSRDQSLMLAIGPEGGWHDFEVELFSEIGFAQTSLGARILRVEHALCYLLGQIEIARKLSGDLATEQSVSFSGAT
jgi:RsmE family RNA methyltransferase